MTLEEALKEIEILKLQNKKIGEAFDSLDKKYDSLKLELELAQACHKEKCAEFDKLCFDYAKLQVKNEKFEQNMKNVLEIEKKNKEQIDDGFENYDKLKSQIAFFKEETERAKLSLNKKIEEYNQLSFRFCQQSYEKYKLLSNFVEKLKEKSYVNNYCEEVIRINDIDKILEESKNDN